MNAYGGMYPFGEPDNSEENTKTYENLDSWLREHDAKVKEDTIKEFVERMKKHEYASVEGREYAILIAEMIAEQMKEQNIK